MNKLIKAIIVIASMLTVSSSKACTYFFLKTTDNSIISARTDEFHSETESKIEIVPRGIKFTSTAPNGAKALTWTSKLGFVSISAFNNIPLEGMNEAGLTTGGLFFSDVEFPKIQSTDKNVLNLTESATWILSNFKTVAELKQGLAQVKIWSSPENPLHMPVIPIHLYVTDALGNSVVLEYIGGKLKIWDNTQNGVMTNEPDLGWHLNNLRHYTNMNPYAPAVMKTPGASGDWALGTGLLGLPGDYTPASRFTKISILKHWSKQPTTANAGVILATHLIDTVDIPYGPQSWIQENQKATQWTVWTVIYDQTNRHFYYRTYDNPTLRRIDLNKLSFAEGTKRKQFPLFTGNCYIDDTNRFITN